MQGAVCAVLGILNATKPERTPRFPVITLPHHGCLNVRLVDTMSVSLNSPRDFWNTFLHEVAYAVELECSHGSGLASRPEEQLRSCVFCRKPLSPVERWISRRIEGCPIQFPPIASA